MYKITVFFKDGFRYIYDDAKNYFIGDEELEININEKQTVFINKRETTIISIIKVGDK